MKLLLINYMETTEPGGINRAVREVGAEMVQRGHAVTVLQANPANLPAEEMCNGFKIIRVTSRVASSLYDLNPAMYCYLRNNFSRLNPDVVHVHGYASLLPWEIMHFLRRTKCPTVFSPHYGPESHNTYSGKYLWNTYNKLIGKHSFDVADMIICASQFESENIQSAFGVTKNKIEVIPHGVDHVAASKAPRSDECISLIYYGWLIELKGVQHILNALHELRRKFNKCVELSIVGEGSYKSTLRQLAKELGVESSISWHSFLFGEELCKKIRAADVFLLLSRSENYGIAVAEALALKVPSIVAETTALVEFLDEPGCFGIGYPPDPTELAELIIKVKDTNPRVGPLSERIRTWEQVARKYEKTYATFLHNTTGQG